MRCNPSLSPRVRSQGQAETNVCEQNKQDGILVNDSGTLPKLVNNQCRGNELTGILFKQGAQGKAESNLCEQNKQDGILVSDSGTLPELVNNQCSGNEHFGIEFYDAQGRAERNGCEQNHWSGITVGGSDASPVDALEDDEFWPIGGGRCQQ